MTWIYHQSTGEIYHNSQRIGSGYSGKGIHKNDPDSQNIPSEGPIPRGTYSIGNAYKHQSLGPITMNLDPIGGQDMFGRNAFRIHGDNSTGTASKGCIVLGKNIREEISKSSDKTLEVIK